MIRVRSISSIFMEPVKRSLIMMKSPAYILEAGMNILVAGFAATAGAMVSQASRALYQDSTHVLDASYPIARTNGLSDDIFVMGRSLGSAAASTSGTGLLKKSRVIIIDSGFAHSLPLAARLGYDIASAGIERRRLFQQSHQNSGNYYSHTDSSRCGRPTHPAS